MSNSQNKTLAATHHKTAIRRQRIAFTMVRLSAYFVLVILAIILGFIIFKGLRYSVITSSFYTLKEEKSSDGFYIVVNKKQKQKKAITWDSLTGMFGDFFLTWKKIDGSDEYVEPVMPMYTGADLDKFNQFFFKGREVSFGRLVQQVETSTIALEKVASVIGAVTIVKKDDFNTINDETKKKLKILPLRQFVVTATDKLKNQENFNDSLKLKDVKSAIKNNLLTEVTRSQADIENLNMVRLTSIEKGWNFTPKFLTTMPEDSGASGGILSIIINTIYLLLLTLLFSVPLGIMASIYFVELSKEGLFLKVLRFGTETLSGIPSIIFGLVGSIIFVNMLNFSFGLLSGALTLTFMILPTIIRTSEEAIIAVPNSLREASFGLGATHIQTIFRVVIPTAMSGILNGIILAMGRALGETAALIFTMGSGIFVAKNLGSSSRGLATHIYLLFAEGASFENAFATAFVLIIFVLIFNTTSKLVIRKQ